MQINQSHFDADDSRRRRGVALVLVVVLMAIVTVMAYAMLQGAVMQSQIAANETAAAQADAVAESGVELAMYYLQHPQYAASLVPVSGTIPPYWAGGTNLAFTNLSGRATVTVSPSGTTGTLFSITSTGTMTSPTGTSLSKTLGAVAQVNYTFQINQAATSGAALGLSQFHPLTQVMTINQTVGAAYNAVTALGAVTIGTKTNMLGKVSASSVSGAGTWSHTLVAAPSYGTVPPITQVRGYSTYVYNGQNGVAGTLAGTLNSGLYSAIISAAMNDPLQIIANITNSTTITGPITINGSVYVPNGSVTISGVVTINSPATGWPALVVGQQIILLASSTLTVNGICYAGTGIGAGGNTTSALNVTGALLLGTGGISSTYQGTMAVNYNSTQATAPDFTSNPIYMTPKSVKLISWTP